jgi:3-oxoadipate enol-lactonase
MGETTARNKLHPNQRSRMGISHPTSSRSDIADINGAKIAYDITGEGPALVLIHAGIADRRMWDPQIPEFSQHYRVLRYDLRGYGQSTIPPQPYAHHDDLAGLLQHLEIEQAHILGISMGGRVAIEFTLTYPDMVKSLIRVNSFAGETEHSEVLQNAWAEMEKAEEAEGLDAVIELENRLWVDGPNRTPEAVPSEAREQVREMNTALFARIDEHDAAEETPLEPPASDRLSEISVPTLIIVSTEDVPDVHAAAAIMESSIPGSRKVVIPNAAHMVSMERPEEFNRTVLDFLGAL